MEQFYFGLSEETQQSVDAVFIGEMFRLFYNQNKNMLDAMANSSQKWGDDGFG